MGNKVGFLQEDVGVNSSIRLMSMLSLLGSILFGCATLYISAIGKSDNGNGILITFGFLIAAFAPKVIQKFAEERLNTINVNGGKS